MKLDNLDTVLELAAKAKELREELVDLRDPSKSFRDLWNAWVPSESVQHEFRMKWLQATEAELNELLQRIKAL